MIVDDARTMAKDVSHKVRETVLFHYDPLGEASDGEKLEDWIIQSFKNILVKEKPSERDVNLVRGIVLKKFSAWAMSEKCPEKATSQVLNLIEILKPYKNELS